MRRANLRSTRCWKCQQMRCNFSSDTPGAVLNVGNIEASYYGRIKVLSLNRPEARNALSRVLVDRLRLEVASLRREPEEGNVRALIIASDVDNAFCAGADLKERRTFSQEQ